MMTKRRGKTTNTEELFGNTESILDAIKNHVGGPLDIIDREENPEEYERHRNAPSESDQTWVKSYPERAMVARLKNGRVPDDYLHSRLSKMVYPPGPKYMILRQCHETLMRYAKNREWEKRWLILLGGTGTGKTKSAVGILRAFLHYANPKNRALFVPVRTYLDNCNKWSNHATTAPRGFDEISNASAVLLDDLGAESVDEKNRSHIAEVVNVCSAYRRPLIITSNASIGHFLGDESEGWLDARTRSRLREASLILTLDGPDYRTQETEEST